MLQNAKWHKQREKLLRALYQSNILDSRYVCYKIARAKFQHYSRSYVVTAVEIVASIHNFIAGSCNEAA